MTQLDLFTPPVSRPIPPSDPNVRESDKRRLTGQNASVLARLRQGPATAFELMNCGDKPILKYTSRVSDLRKRGFDVRYDEDTGLYRLVEH